MGSFFIPMLIMVYVYARISCVVASRHDQMSEIKVHQVKFPEKSIINFIEMCQENSNFPFFGYLFAKPFARTKSKV